MQRRINRFQLMEKRRTESASALEIVISRVLINLLFAFCCCRRCGDVEILSLSLSRCKGSCCRFPSYFQHDVVIICIIYAACTSTRDNDESRERSSRPPPPLPGTAASAEAPDAKAARPNDRHLRDLHCTPALWDISTNAKHSWYNTLFRLCGN